MNPLPGVPTSSTSAAPLALTATSSQAPYPRSRPTSRPQSTGSWAASKAPPGPSRTLKQPMTLHVAEKGRQGAGAGVGGQGDAAEYKRALERRAAVARRAEKWIDRAMEEVLGRDVFLKTLTYMHRASYIEAQHERHLNGMCGYPLCPNAPAAPYRSGKRFVVSTAQRTVTERDGNDDQAFCSRKCAARAAYVLQQLGTEAPWLASQAKGSITLLDELEDSGEVAWGRGDVLIWTKRASPDTSSGTTPKAPESLSSATTEPETGGKATGDPTDRKDSGDKSTEDKTDRKDKEDKITDTDRRVATLTPPHGARTPDAGVHSLLASLSIVERDTSSSSATAPSLDEPRLPVAPGPVASGSARDAPLPQPQPGPVQVPSILSKAQPQGQPTAPALASLLATSESQANKPKTQAQSRRAAASSLIATDSAMAASVISASRKINTEVQSDDESEEEEEWAKQMGWGDGPEVDALFAAAREARELLEESK